jgi:WD40 repeat protein/energy-coupling factor transporter ATP-binding protein EcfA2
MYQSTTYSDQSTLTEGINFNPFPGLRPFGIEESHLFFGREGQSDEVLNKLAENKFTAVIGASGSGKSSLMYCGLIPILYGGFITEAGSSWKVISTRPGRGPIDNLAESLIQDEDEELSEKEHYTKKSIAAAVLRSSSLGLVEAVKQLFRFKEENILILVDQFEELFRYKRSKNDSSSINESAAFVKLLLEAIEQSEVPIYVVLTMRSDFIGDCAQYPDLTKKINDSHYLIPQMTREDFREAVLGPVAVGGGEISPRLVQQLLNDVGDNQDQLPILQHALMRTWDYWSKNKDSEEPMDINHYDAIGRMEKALSEHANEAFDELTEREKVICESLFKTLTEKGSDGRGIRHPSSIRLIAEIAQCETKEVISVVERFRIPGRSFLNPSINVSLDSNSIIDISHESLMRVWDRLILWVDEEVEAVQLYLRLSEAAQLYQKGQGSLWRPPDLQLALNWREKRKPTLTWAQRYDAAFERAMVFLETSRETYELEEENKIKQQKRSLRRARVFSVVLGSVAIIFLGIMVFAILQRAEAERQKANAETERQRAEDLRIEAESNAEEARIARDEAQESAKIAENAKEEAIAQAQIAEEERDKARSALSLAETRRVQAERATNEAIVAREEAIASAEEAEKQKVIAEDASDKAFSLRMLSIARSMAVKSVQLQKDTSQKALVAFQAYKFNKVYGDNQHNPDVYAGLYSALKFLEEPDYNRLKGHKDGIRSIVFNNSGERMFTTGSDGKVLMWDMKSPDHTNSLLIENIFLNRSLAISQNDNYLACITQFSTLQIFDLNNPGSTPKELVLNDEVAWAMTFTPENTLLVSYDNGSILEWDLKKDTSELFIQKEERFISLALSPDGKQVAGGTENGNIYVWDKSNPSNEKLVFKEARNTIHALNFNNSGTLLAAGDQQGNIRIWNTSEYELVNTLEGHSARVHEIRFSPNDSLLASASFDRTVQMWHTASLNEQPTVLNDHNDWVWTLAFSPDNENIIVGCVDNLIRIYPTDAEVIADQICGKLNRNMSQSEWNRFVASDIDREKTCENIPLD